MPKQNHNYNPFSPMSTKKEKCWCAGTDWHPKSESIEWEKDSWCVSIVAEAMTFARTEPIGKDASHITRKLRERVSQAITTAVAKERQRILGLPCMEDEEEGVFVDERNDLRRELKEEINI
jgi:hypothetical protein